MGLFLAGGSAYTRRQGLRRLKQRLENVPGASNIRYEPSAIKPTTVVVDVDIEMFLEEPFPRDTGRLEVVYRPREETDLQRVQWIDDAVGLGWHKDRAHPDLGTTQFQCETGDGATPRRDPAHIEVEAPVSFPESCLDRLPDRIRETGGWSGVRGVGVRLLSERASRSENRTHHTHPWPPGHCPRRRGVRLQTHARVRSDRRPVRTARDGCPQGARKLSPQSGVRRRTQRVPRHSHRSKEDAHV